MKKSPAKNLADLIFPSRCIGCSQLGISICSNCRSSWHPHTYFREVSVEGSSYPVVSSVQYSPVASRVLLSAKESNIDAADKLLIAAITHSLNHFVKRFGGTTLVAIPSRRSATRKRGRNFLSEITSEVSRISENKITFIDSQLLIHSRGVKDQSALNSRQRLSNISGALKVPSKFTPRISGGNIGPLIVVDDLITTGATLAEAIRALLTAGFEVKGAVTGAVAKPLR
jgi:predicted amidophosphoribosyltransferase